MGEIASNKDNVVWIFHAMTANSDPSDWWAGMVGEGKFFDPRKYFIICVNMPGSYYGSVNPLDNNEKTGMPFLQDFPFFTPMDMASCLLYTSPSPRDRQKSRMPSSA